MNKTAARKAYDAEIAKFATLNNASDSCQTETEYAVLMEAQKPIREQIHARLESLRRSC